VGDLYNINEEETYKGSAGVEDPALCSTAIFYSITSTQTGLQGIELGNSLIKQAVKKLKDEFPTMSQFSTLSPIPGFKTWLMTTLQMARKGQGREVLNDEEKAKILKTFYGPTDDFYDSLCTAFKSNQWAQNEKLRDALELPLMRLCSQYLFLEKRRNFALDPVANFHLRNGSTMWRLNWWADLSPRGLNNSCGIMVNYRYYLDKLESNSTQYQESKTIDTSEQIRQLAAQAQVLMIKPDDQAAKL
jgi:malonyl-CoA decarboxylase